MKAIDNKVTGSLVNALLLEENETPKKGHGATIIRWTDRHAYEVIWVSEDLTAVKLMRYKPTPLHIGMTDSQKYEYKDLVGEPVTLLLSNNQWYREIKIEREGEKPTTTLVKTHVRFGILDEYYDHSF